MSRELVWRTLGKTDEVRSNGNQEKLGIGYRLYPKTWPSKFRK
jgi:hypothetical protein